jgi:hypothetical protein
VSPTVYFFFFLLFFFFFFFFFFPLQLLPEQSGVVDGNAMLAGTSPELQLVSLFRRISDIDAALTVLSKLQLEVPQLDCSDRSSATQIPG